MSPAHPLPSEAKKRRQKYFHIKNIESSGKQEVDMPRFETVLHDIVLLTNVVLYRYIMKQFCIYDTHPYVLTQ